MNEWVDKLIDALYTFVYEYILFISNDFNLIIIYILILSKTQNKFILNKKH